MVSLKQDVADALHRLLDHPVALVGLVVAVAGPQPRPLLVHRRDHVPLAHAHVPQPVQVLEALVAELGERPGPPVPGVFLGGAERGPRREERPQAVVRVRLDPGVLGGFGDGLREGDPGHGEEFGLWVGSVQGGDAAELGAVRVAAGDALGVGEGAGCWGSARDGWYCPLWADCPCERGQGHCRLEGFEVGCGLGWWLKMKM